MIVTNNIATPSATPLGLSSALNLPPSISSFATQLVTAIEDMLAKSKTGSQIEIDIDAAPAGSSGHQQITMILKNLGQPASERPAPRLDGGPTLAPDTLPLLPSTGVDAGASGGTAAGQPPATPPVTSPSAASPGATTQAAAPADALPETPIPFFQSLITGSTRTPAAWADTVDGAAALAPPKPMTATDAYWASQPPEVRALRKEPDEAVRATEAMKLAQQGFAIDVPIMVWGWNPLMTMQLRQADGYTWVPSGLQDAIPVTPGYQMAGYPSYDPLHPPAGSIRVTTDFAIGTLDDPARSHTTTTVTG